MKPQLYRKVPVVIEAWQFTEDNHSLVATWCKGYARFVRAPDQEGHYNPYIEIPTLEGTTIASLGDFVIRGVAGEFYACKPDIFDLTYEKADYEPPV